MAKFPYHTANSVRFSSAGHLDGGNVPLVAVSVKPTIGPISSNIKCPECGACVRTSVEHRTTAMTHFLSIMMCWTACLCWLPYCINSCRDADHFCPMCGVYIGTFKS